MSGLSSKTIKYIIQVLSEFPAIKQALFFGSRAMGNYKKGSDIDIALKGDAITFNLVNSVHEKLENDIPVPYFFDVVDYKDLKNMDLKNHIDTQGKVFYENIDS